MTAAQADPLDLASSSGTSEISTIPAAEGAGATMAAAAAAQQMPAQAFSTPTSMPNFITPAMWQESVASVYEGGLKRSWDYDAMQAMKRR